MRVLLILAVVSLAHPASILAQSFRIPRPVPDRYPLNGAYLYAETNFGDPHRGADIPMAIGDSVYSVCAGKVIEKEYEAAGCGNYVMIQSEWQGRQLWYLYCHFVQASPLNVGDSVAVGDLVGLAGSTGNSTGPHLHFEIRIGSPSYGTYENRRNPELWFAMHGMGAIYGRVPGAPDGTRVDITPDPKPRPPYTSYSYSLTYTFDGTIGSDDVYKENYVIGDVLPGSYTITALGGAYRRLVRVGPGQVVNADETSPVAVRDAGAAGYTLLQNYPNPFNPGTRIGLRLPSSQRVTVSIFNLLGQRIATLFDGVAPAGGVEVDWSGVDSEGRPVSSGIYYYEMTAGSFTARKMMLKLK